jgi:uncharacterized lipoprotein YddW (UPF0748 family)
MAVPLLAAVLLSSASGAMGLALPAEMRGLWVVRTALVSPEAVDRVVDEAADAGFNALFAQVRGRADAFYASSLVPRSVLLERQPRTFDPLARLIERARARKLEVHAWINVLLAAGFAAVLPADHVVTTHPEWLMVPRAAADAVRSAPRSGLAAVIRDASRNPDVEGFYLSPSAPGVSEHLQAVVAELLRSYDLHGLHLDFIRYPAREFDYSPEALRRFGSLAGSSERTPEPGDPSWTDYRRDVLTALVERLASKARSERPRVVVSSAVVPDEAAAAQHKFQAWPAWIARGLLDAVCPMIYTPDSRVYRAQVELARALAGPDKRVWAGVGAYRLPVEGTLEKIALARAAGAAGVVLFSHESLSSADFKKLRAAWLAWPAGAAHSAPASGAR